MNIAELELQPYYLLIVPWLCHQTKHWWCEVRLQWKMHHLQTTNGHLTPLVSCLTSVHGFWKWNRWKFVKKKKKNLKEQPWLINKSTFIKLKRNFNSWQQMRRVTEKPVRTAAGRRKDPNADDCGGCGAVHWFNAQVCGWVGQSGDERWRESPWTSSRGPQV